MKNYGFSDYHSCKKNVPCYYKSYYKIWRPDVLREITNLELIIRFDKKITNGDRMKLKKQIKELIKKCREDDLYDWCTDKIMEIENIADEYESIVRGRVSEMSLKKLTKFKKYFISKV